MAVVAQQVVHASGVQFTPALHRHVPVEILTLGEVELVVARRLSKSEMSPVDGIGSGEIVDDSVLISDADVADERQYPGEHRERAPYDAVRILPFLQVDDATHGPVDARADYGSSQLEALRGIRALRLGPRMPQNLGNRRLLAAAFLLLPIYPPSYPPTQLPSGSSLPTQQRT